MSYSAEFIIQTEQFQHVQLTIDGQDFVDQFMGKDEPMEELLGDYWASLKAAVLYGRDQAFAGLTKPVPEPESMRDLVSELEQANAKAVVDSTLKALSEVFAPGLPSDTPKTAPQGAVEALKEGLGATVLSEEEKPSEAPSSPSSRPWKNKPKAKKQQPWEDPIQDGPDATPEEAVAATKAARKAAAASDWDF